MVQPVQQMKVFDFVGRAKIWFALSWIFIFAGIVMMAVRGINWGIDFTGGTLIELRFTHDVAQTSTEEREIVAGVRQLLRGSELASSPIQVSGGNELFVRTAARNSAESQGDADKLLRVLSPKYPGIQIISRQLVGPVIGRELKLRAILATLIGCIGILIYVTVRYEFKFAVAAIIALFHDIMVLLAFVALSHNEADSSLVAVLLTVVGYSVNDTVVIFDRIRENMKLRRREPFEQIANVSLMETLGRSIYTVLTVEFCLLTLFLFGGTTIHTFALDMIVGITTGCYSSIFIATPVVDIWKRKTERALPAAMVAARRTASAPAAPTRTARPTVNAGSQPQRPETAPAANNGAETAAANNGNSESTAAEPAEKRIPAKKAAARSGKRKRRH